MLNDLSGNGTRTKYPVRSLWRSTPVTSTWENTTHWRVACGSAARRGVPRQWSNSPNRKRASSI